MLLALDGLPDSKSADETQRDRPLVAEPAKALFDTWNAWGERLVLAGHTDTVRSAAFSPDGRHVVTSSSDRTARVWNAETGAEELIIQAQDSIGVAIYSPDGRTILTAGGRNTARLWDLEGNLINVLDAGPVGNTILAATFSRDGRRILTETNGSSAQLWEF